MSISGISPTTATGGLTGGQNVDKDAFINLLVLQLKNQDPLDPVENQEMLAQLAQFSSLEQMQQLNTSALTQLAATESVNNALATSLIGREVTALGEQLDFDGETPVSGQFLSNAQAPTVAEILDASGRVVRQIDLGTLGTGWHDVTWNGLTDTGAPAPPGTYTYRVVEDHGNGQTGYARTFVSGRVDGVRFEDGVTYLLVGGRQVTLGEVLEINTADTTGATSNATTRGGRY